MALFTGQKLGPYEVIKPAGAGGMGEVYKAKDTRLDRVVAIKVLPSEISDDAQRRARFEREAKAISSLSHPNICTIHDVGNEGGIEYLVMEYMEGKTLSDRLAKGPLPIDQVLIIGGEIADALDKAHRQGVIHRDLKPGNVMLTGDGAKLLDFGLAKAIGTSGVDTRDTEATDTVPLTDAHAIVGTLHYMSPEQLQGKEAGARSDIFAFGAMLYEMMTGKRAFDGESKAEIIGKVLNSRPQSISGRSTSVPPNLERLITKCLHREPDLRWQTARDLADELRWIGRSHISQDGSVVAEGKRKRTSRLSRGTVALMTVMVIIAVAAWTLLRTGEKPNKPATQFTISPQEGQERIFSPKISPNGQLLAYQATDSLGRSSIWIRPIDSAGSYPLEGTEDVWRPFWSPDSRYLAFFADNNTRLMKLPVTGGPPTLICETNGADGTWGSENVLLYDISRTPLYRVSSSGGTPSAETVLDTSRGEGGHLYPHFLPDGEHYLFCIKSYSGWRVDESIVSVGRLGSTEVKRLIAADTRPIYSPEGYVLYMSSGVLFAHSFDTEDKELVGARIPLTDQALGNEYSVSNHGTLVYTKHPSEIFTPEELVWFDRSGNVVGKIGGPAEYGDISLSPDGNKVAYIQADSSGTQTDVWIYDIKQGGATRLTFDPGSYHLPVWSPDGTRLLFSKLGATHWTTKIYQRRVDGTGTRQLFKAEDTGASAMVPRAWSAVTGQLLCTKQFYDSTITKVTRDIYLMDAQNPSTTRRLTNTDFQELSGALSPNGQYYAYYADPSVWADPVNPEVYVREVDGDGHWQISIGGGRYPMWSSDGRELFYFSLEWDLMSVPVSTENGFNRGVPTRLFRQKVDYPHTLTRRYDVTPDGERFLMVVPAREQYRGEFVVTQNWTELLEGKSAD